MASSGFWWVEEATDAAVAAEVATWGAAVAEEAEAVPEELLTAVFVHARSVAVEPVELVALLVSRRHPNLPAPHHCQLHKASEWHALKQR